MLREPHERESVHGFPLCMAVNAISFLFTAPLRALISKANQPSEKRKEKKKKKSLRFRVLKSDTRVGVNACKSLSSDSDAGCVSCRVSC